MRHMFRLMIKVHRKTKMKYLCVTSREDYQSYKGSGIYWGRHLKQHGHDVRTFLLFESSDLDLEFMSKCREYSEKWDIVKRDDFANLVPEYGTMSWVKVKESFPDLNEYWSIESSKQSKQRQIDGIVSYWNSEVGQMNKHRYSKMMKKRWNKVDVENLSARISVGIRNSEKWSRYKERIPYILANRTDEEKADIVAKTTQTRLNRSEEAKARTADLVRESFKKSEKRIAFVESMKESRKGKGNPSATKISYYGKIIGGQKDIENLAETMGLTLKQLYDNINDKIDVNVYWIKPPRTYEQIVCPHCQKIGGANSMQRWHMDRCKFKRG